MSSAAAISGEFTTIKHVPSRKVYQLVVEIAEEAAQQAFEALGMPGNGGHVALARLHSPAEPIAKPEAPKERRPFSELPYSQQAAMRCQEPDLWGFFRNRGFSSCINADHAAHAVRMACAVGSRSDIVKGTPAGDLWEILEAEYYAWQRGRR